MHRMNTKEDFIIKVRQSKAANHECRNKDEPSSIVMTRNQSLSQYTELLCNLEVGMAGWEAFLVTFDAHGDRSAFNSSSDELWSPWRSSSLLFRSSSISNLSKWCSSGKSSKRKAWRRICKNRGELWKIQDTGYWHFVDRNNNSIRVPYSLQLNTQIWDKTTKCEIYATWTISIEHHR